MKHTDDYCLGVVIDSNDPERLGRCKVRVMNVYDELEDNELPYAYPNTSTFFSGNGGFGTLSIPKKNTIVKVFFVDDDIHHPMWENILHINEELRNRLKEISDDKLEGTHIFGWDVDNGLYIMHTIDDGYQQIYKESSFNINPDSSILIDHKDSESNLEFARGNVTLNAVTKIEENSPHIHVNGKKTDIGSVPVYSEVLGEILLAGLMEMAVVIDAKFPPTPGLAIGIVANMQAALSKTVKTSP